MPISWFTLENASSYSIDDIRSIINPSDSGHEIWEINFQYYKGEAASFLLVNDSSLENVVLVKDAVNWLHFEKNFFKLPPEITRIVRYKTTAATNSKGHLKQGLFLDWNDGEKLIFATERGDRVKETLPFIQPTYQSDCFISGLKEMSNFLIK